MTWHDDVILLLLCWCEVRCDDKRNDDDDVERKKKGCV